MAITVRTVGPDINGGYTDAMNFTVPAGVQTGDTVVLFFTFQSVTTADLGTQVSLAGWTQVAAIRNTGRTQQHVCAVWAYTNAPASLSGTVVTPGIASGGNYTFAARFVILTPGYVRADRATPNTSTAAVTSTFSVFDATADLILPVVTATMPSPGNVVGGQIWTSADQILAQSRATVNSAAVYNAGILLGRITDYSRAYSYDGWPGTPAYHGTVQIVASPYPYVHKAKLAAKGTVGGARGFKTIPAFVRVVGPDVNGSGVGNPATINVTVPTGVQTGDTVLLCLAYHCPAAADVGTQTSLAGWTQVALLRNTNRPAQHVLAVWALRDATAALSGTVVTPVMVNGAGTFTYAARILVLSRSAVSAAAPRMVTASEQTTTFTGFDQVADLILPAINDGSGLEAGAQYGNVWTTTNSTIVAHSRTGFSGTGLYNSALMIGRVTNRGQPVTYVGYYDSNMFPSSVQILASTPGPTVNGHGRLTSGASTVRASGHKVLTQAASGTARITAGAALSARGAGQHPMAVSGHARLSATSGLKMAAVSARVGVGSLAGSAVLVARGTAGVVQQQHGRGTLSATSSVHARGRTARTGAAAWTIPAATLTAHGTILARVVQRPSRGAVQRPDSGTVQYPE